MGSCSVGEAMAHRAGLDVKGLRVEIFRPLAAGKYYPALDGETRRTGGRGEWGGYYDKPPHCVPCSKNVPVPRNPYVVRVEALKILGTALEQ